MNTPISSITLVLVGSVIGSLGAIFLKSGAHALTRQWTSIVFNWRLAVGIATYLLSSVLFVKGMTNGELSVLFPMVSVDTSARCCGRTCSFRNGSPRRNWPAWD